MHYTFNVLSIPLVFSYLLFFCTNRVSLLVMLLALEGIALSVLNYLVLTQLMSSQNNLFLIFFFLSVMACEASLGLAILVAMVRAYGTDHLKTLSLTQC